MTDNDIIKALECCLRIRYDDFSICKTECPYAGNCFDLEKGTNANRDWLDLINRQKAEIERLTEDSRRLKKVKMQLDDAMKMYHVIKAEAVKEFAERIKKHCTSIELNAYIDSIVEEMVGEK